MKYRDEEFIKSAGFAIMAQLAVHDKKANNSKFKQFFPIIKGEAIDERNFIKKLNLFYCFQLFVDIMVFKEINAK